MDKLTKQLSSILAAQLPEQYTSVSYAIQVGGRLIAADALGNRGGPDKVPADLSCSYNVASVSKIFCTVAVMQLVEQGKVDLDAPVAEYLPRLYMPDDRYRLITLRHCLSHTSGLPGTQWRGFSVSALGNEDYYDDVYEYLSQSILKADPGEYAVYCNDGFTLAEMVVAAVSGMSYGEYCLKHITEPIGAESTRLSGMHAPNHPLIREGDRLPELLLIRGGAGYTTSMPDLCRFGRLFLSINPVISEESKREMASSQGRTFLNGDDRTADFGLGWDNVNFRDSDYDLGEGVLLKTGNSFQFTTHFYIIPKYDAVLAISETHDCRLDVGKAILRLFATTMLDRGCNLYARARPVPKEIKERSGGVYLTQNCVLRVCIDGAIADILREKMDGNRECSFKDLYWDGNGFISETGQRFFFEESGTDRYILTTLKGRTSPFAMQAKCFASPPQAWVGRVGKKYIACNVRPNDIVAYDLMTGFGVYELTGYTGVIVLSFSCRNDSGTYRSFDGCILPVDDRSGHSFLNTPGNPSRDALHPRFYIQDGIEYCDVASYRYIDSSSLSAYAGESFKESLAPNSVYRIDGKLQELPQIPAGRRILVLKEDMVVQYDSLMEAKYTPVEKGFILLI